MKSVIYVVQFDSSQQPDSTDRVPLRAYTNKEQADNVVKRCKARQQQLAELGEAAPRDRVTADLLAGFDELPLTAVFYVFRLEVELPDKTPRELELEEELKAAKAELSKEVKLNTEILAERDKYGKKWRQFEIRCNELEAKLREQEVHIAHVVRQEYIGGTDGTNVRVFATQKAAEAWVQQVLAYHKAEPDYDLCQAAWHAWYRDHPVSNFSDTTSEFEIRQIPFNA